MTGYEVLLKEFKDVGLHINVDAPVNNYIITRYDKASTTIPLDTIIHMYGTLNFLHFDQTQTILEIIDFINKKIDLELRNK